jgi:hypothetical protein
MGYVSDCYSEGCGFTTPEHDDPQGAADDLAQHLHFNGHTRGSEPHEPIPDPQ